jgi:hypothetical protein
MADVMRVYEYLFGNIVAPPRDTSQDQCVPANRKKNRRSWDMVFDNDASMFLPFSHG